MHCKAISTGKETTTADVNLLLTEIKVHFTITHRSCASSHFCWGQNSPTIQHIKPSCGQVGELCCMFHIKTYYPTRTSPIHHFSLRYFAPAETFNSSQKLTRGSHMSSLNDPSISDLLCPKVQLSSALFLQVLLEFIAFFRTFRPQRNTESCDCSSNSQSGSLSYGRLTCHIITMQACRLWFKVSIT